MMGLWKRLVVSLAISFLLTSNMVYADTFQSSVTYFILPDSPIWGVKLFVESFELGIAERFADSTTVAELKLKHASERERESIALAEQGKAIPQKVMDLHDRDVSDATEILNTKTKEIETPEQSNIVASLRDKIASAFNGGKLLEFRSKFMDIRYEQNQVKKIKMANELDNEVNNPLVVVTCLGKINSLEVANSDNPYGNLQNQCPILQSVSEDMAKKEVGTYGN